MERIKDRYRRKRIIMINNMKRMGIDMDEKMEGEL